MRLWMIGLAASLALGTAASAMYRKWGPWTPGKNLSASFWPKGANVLVNRKERVDGHMLNSYDRFQYRGDAKALNAFLLDLDKVDGPKGIQLLGPDVNLGFITHGGKGWTGRSASPRTGMPGRAFRSMGRTRSAR